MLIAKRSISRARFAPETVFAHPRELVAEPLLTRGQKKAALARWRLHLQEKIRAAEEGMPVDLEELLTDSRTLAAIAEAEHDLDDTEQSAA